MTTCGMETTATVKTLQAQIVNTRLIDCTHFTVGDAVNCTGHTDDGWEIRDRWFDVVLRRREPVYNSVDAHDDDDTLLPRWVNWIARASAISRAPPPGILPSEWKNQHQEQVEWEGRKGMRGGNVPIFELLFDVPFLPRPSFSLSLSRPPLTLFLYLSLDDMIRDPSRDVYPYPRDNGTALLDALRKFAAPNCVF